MKIIKKEEASIYKNSETSSILEYSDKLNERNMDFCINTISGRYPENGYCSNEECQELCFVLDGNGYFNKRNEKVEFNQGDIIFIEKRDIYFWEGNCKLAIVCTPAWSKEQCKLYEE